MQRRSDAYLWRPAHMLAAELVQWGTDANLVKTAAAVMKDAPDTDFIDWLERLERLGDLFSSSDQTGRYRQQLRHVCLHVQQQYKLQSGAEWAWVLAWASRLMPHYGAHPRAAERISRVGVFELPPPLPPFQRVSAEKEDLLDLPEVRDEVSDTAQTLFEQMQAMWRKQEGK